MLDPEKALHNQRYAVINAAAVLCDVLEDHRLNERELYVLRVLERRLAQLKELEEQ